MSLFCVPSDDDYEYETSDQAVEDMRPGSDNYYRGSKISDEEWIRERSENYTPLVLY